MLSNLCRKQRKIQKSSQQHSKPRRSLLWTALAVDQRVIPWKLCHLWFNQCSRPWKCSPWIFQRANVSFCLTSQIKMRLNSVTTASLPDSDKSIVQSRSLLTKILYRIWLGTTILLTMCSIRGTRLLNMAATAPRVSLTIFLEAKFSCQMTFRIKRKIPMSHWDSTN